MKVSFFHFECELTERFLFLLLLLLLYFVHFVVPMGRCPQEKPAAKESHYPTDYTVHAWSFRVSIIHRTLTWTQDL